MGWTVSYQVVRDRTLDSGELAKLAELVRGTNAEPFDGESFELAIPSTTGASGVVARGFTKLPFDDESSDAERLCEALTVLQQMLPDARVNAEDDFDTLAWDVAAVRFDFGARTRRKLVDDADCSGWRSILELVPPSAPATAASLANALALHASGAALGDALRTDEALIAEAFEALLPEAADRKPIVALLDACDGDVVARVGLGRYAELQHEYAVRHALDTAFARVRDVAALAPAFLAMWRAPKGTYFYGDLALPPAFARAIAAQPSVRDQLIADIDAVEAGVRDSDISRRCADRAALLLGGSGDARATRRLVEIVRRWRGERPDHAIKHYVYLPALEGLARGARPQAAATLLLALDGSPCTYRGEVHAIEGAAGSDVTLALPVLRRLLEQGIALGATLGAVIKLGPAGAPLADVIAPYLAYPRRGVRADARAALTAIGHLDGGATDPGEPDPETLVIHPDRDVRHAALRTIQERRDPSLFLSLVIAETIDAALRIKIDDPSLPFSWHEWHTMLPEEVRRMFATERLAWAESEAAAALGPQRVLPVLAEVRGRPPRDVVAKVELRLRLDEVTRRALAVAETAALSSPPA